MEASREWRRPSPVSHVSRSMLAQVSEVMLLDSHWDVLVHKRSLQNIPYRKSQLLFTKTMRTLGEKQINPYFRAEKIDFYYLKKNDIFLVAAIPSPDQDVAISAVLYLDFLQRLYDILKDCLGCVNEAYTTVNRMLVFEVLDEILNQGYGLISSFNEIKPFLTFEPIRPKAVQQDLATRFFGINVADRSRQNTEKKAKAANCAYINIVEGLSAVFGLEGEVVSCELWGKLSLISTLRRPGPLVIQLSPQLVTKSSSDTHRQVAGAVHVENPSFHGCVDTSQLADRKQLTVLPPPGQTRLMEYTLGEPACIHLPLILLPSLIDIPDSRDKNLTLRLINQADTAATATYVKVKVTLPQCVHNLATTKSGTRQTCQFNTDDRTIEWDVKKLPGGMEESIICRLIVQSHDLLKFSEVGPITVNFNITNFSASGLVVHTARIDNIKSCDNMTNVKEQSPECFFGASTKSASYSVRTATAHTLSSS